MASGFEKEFSLMDVNMNINKTQVSNSKFQVPSQLEFGAWNLELGIWGLGL